MDVHVNVNAWSETKQLQGLTLSTAVPTSKLPVKWGFPMTSDHHVEAGFAAGCRSPHQTPPTPLWPCGPVDLSPSSSALPQHLCRALFATTRCTQMRACVATAISARIGTFVKRADTCTKTFDDWPGYPCGPDTAEATARCHHFSMWLRCSGMGDLVAVAVAMMCMPVPDKLSFMVRSTSIHAAPCQWLRTLRISPCAGSDARVSAPWPPV